MNSQRKSIGRAVRLAQMGAGIAGSYLAYQLQRPFLDEQQSSKRRHALHRKQAKRVREDLQDLRGPEHLAPLDFINELMDTRNYLFGCFCRCFTQSVERSQNRLLLGRLGQVANMTAIRKFSHLRRGECVFKPGDVASD